MRKNQIFSLRRILSRLGIAQASLALLSLLQNLVPTRKRPVIRCNGGVGGEKSVFTRRSMLIRTTKKLISCIGPNTFQERWCSRRRIHPLLCGGGNGEVSVTGWGTDSGV